MPHVEWDRTQNEVLDLPADAAGTVLGAPGSGKTATIVERVVRLIAPETGRLEPDELLVLTPSRASATRLRDRIGGRTPRATPGPLARSVGSLAFGIVRAAAASRGEPAPQLLTGAEQDRILAQLIEGDAVDERISWPEGLPLAVRRSRDFRSELRVLLDAGIELDASRDEMRLLGDEAWAAAGELLADYARALAGMRTAARDAAELLEEATRIARSDEPCAEIDRLRVVLIDDAQELTRGGVDLVAALRDRGTAVLAFGDPDIASGAFRGVTPDLFSGLSQRLGDVHVLAGQHRATEPIAWLTRRITETIGAAGRVDHRQAPGPQPELGDAVSVIRAASPFDEADAIARRLREWHLSDGVRWDRMAVIAHDTRQLVALESELAAREVPTRAAGVSRPLGAEQAVRQIVEIVELALADPADRPHDALISALRSPYGGFDGVALRRLRSSLRHAELGAGGARPARELVLEALAAPAALAVVDTPEGRAAARFAETLRAVHEAGRRGATVHELLWEVWDRARTVDGRRLSGEWRRLATASGPRAAETSRALDGLVSLFAAAKRRIERSPEEGPGPFIREILDSDVPEDTLLSPEQGGTVSLLTPVSALSTEFDAVVIAGLQDGVWPNTRLRGGLLGTWRFADALSARRSGAEPLDVGLLDRRREVLGDEMRLFVRALSRARTHLLVTAVDDDDHIPSPLLRSLPDPVAPDQRAAHPLTLRGLVAHHRRTLTTSDDEEALVHAAAQLRALADAGVPGADPDEWYGVRPASTTAPMRDLDAGAVRVSPSRIGEFEECALSWAIRSLGGDTVTSPSAGLGTLVHAALERVPEGGVDAMRAVIDERWSELDFETPWVARRERRRADEYVARLDAYLANVRAEQGRAVAAEAPFRYAVTLDDTPEVVLETDGPRRAVVAGTIDRVEAYPRGEGDHRAARGRGSEAIRPAADDSDEVSIVVDLKSGKSEARTTDAKVEDDAQLLAYQLAVESGLVPGAPPGSRAGARLVVVSQTTAKSRYRIAHQHVIAGDAREAFLARVADAARGMSAATFSAPVETHCAAEQWAPVCRIHTIGAVSA
ncbi:ATP-dependent helicase [Microbacterium sp. gxy059]|uniref:ATP-dependent helicase n=1 Tax=Microbacterium sp. gxy059 TaxID=2957199 RepID=UPI003D95A78B